MLICVLAFCSRLLFYQSLLQGLEFHQVVSAGRHPVAIFKLDKAGVQFPTRKDRA